MSPALSVPEGYKMTEVGVIPGDWEVKQIADLHPFVTSGSRGWADFYSEYGDVFIRISNLSRQSIYLELEDLQFVQIPKISSEGARTELQDSDVLISITADIGIIGNVTPRITKPAYINQHIALVRFNKYQTDSRFISYFLSSEPSQKKFRALSDSGAKAGMNLNTVQQIKLALPPTKAEQQAIAEALSDADALVESLEQLLVKKRQIKQGAMQELLTGQNRLPGFSGKFVKMRMRDVLSQSATYGIVTAGNFVQSGIKMLRGGDIDDGRINMDLPMVTLDKSTEYSRTVLCKGDVVISLVGYPGEAATVSDKLVGANISRAVGLLRPNGKINSEFLTFLLNSSGGRRMVLAPSAGSAQQVVNLAALNKLEFLTPPIEEQTAIAAILSDLDSDIAALQSQLVKARQIKQGMAQALLTGRIRLVSPAVTPGVPA